jgi:hypothetical protein
MPKRIFISYRRSDTQMAAGRLRDALVNRFGPASVFRDKEAIRPGYDWVEEIQAALAGDVVVLALVGPQWANSQDGDGHRRLDDPQDSNRVELETALEKKVPVIPVLVESANIPDAESLPRSLRPLTRRNAVRLRDDDWDGDFSRLAEALSDLGMVARTNPRTARDGRRSVALLAWMAGVVFAASVLVGVALWMNSSSPRAGAPRTDGSIDAPKVTPSPSPAPSPPPALVAQPPSQAARSDITAAVAPPVPNIAGTWRDTNYAGVVGQIFQEGSSFRFRRWGVLPNGIGFESSGEGTIDGTRISHRYTSQYQTGAVSTGGCTGSVTNQGASLDMTCTDSLLGTFPVTSTRQ